MCEFYDLFSKMRKVKRNLFPPIAVKRDHEEKENLISEAFAADSVTVSFAAEVISRSLTYLNLIALFSSS